MLRGTLWLWGDASLGGHLSPGRKANLEDGREVRDGRGWWPEPLLEECTALRPPMPLPLHPNPTTLPHPCPACTTLTLRGPQPCSGRGSSSGSEGLRQAGLPREGRSRQQQQQRLGSAAC